MTQVIEYDRAEEQALFDEFFAEVHYSGDLPDGLQDYEPLPGDLLDQPMEDQPRSVAAWAREVAEKAMRI